jgi:hypothetical protein
MLWDVRSLKPEAAGGSFTGSILGDCVRVVHRWYRWLQLVRLIYMAHMDGIRGGKSCDGLQETPTLSLACYIASHLHVRPTALKTWSNQLDPDDSTANASHALGISRWVIGP